MSRLRERNRYTLGPRQGVSYDTVARSPRVAVRERRGRRVDSRTGRSGPLARFSPTTYRPRIPTSQRPMYDTPTQTDE